MQVDTYTYLCMHAVATGGKTAPAFLILEAAGWGVLQWGMDWDAEVHWNLHNCTIACHAVDALVVKDGRSWLLDIRWLWAHKWGGVGGH